MLSIAINEIRACQSFDELRHLWEINRGQWASLPVEDAKALIREKDLKKEAINFMAEVDYMVAWLNSLWARESITMNDIPAEQQKRASHWEAKMTSSADAGRIEEARMALEEWRCCWVPDRLYPLGRPRPLDEKEYINEDQQNPRM
jgi:hypothetical protein